ncbi:MAG: SpoIIE family protein phosphatase, partial [Candidatus Kapabacteria bacterium]|nr:SpoIIE family protein phosphatase [Candidatus Kapabacteria bacterium]
TTMMRRRHKHTMTLLVVQMLLLMGIWFFSTLAVYGSAYNVVAVIMTLVGGILMLVNTRRLHWLSTISMEKKVRLLWLTFCAVFASAVLSVMYVKSGDSFLAISASAFVRSGAVVPSAVNFFGFVFFIRFLFAVIASLPNSGIVDRRSNEVESLAHITRLMSQAVGVDQLLESTTSLAVRICRAHGGWSEVIEGDSFRIVAAQLVHPDYVRVLHANPSLHAIINNGSGPVHVESLRNVAKNVGDVGIRSMIVVPIINERRRTGTLVVFSTIDYGFEADDLRLLTAFGDMVSIGIDQARLMEATLNRERLQKEADVARDIQSSLLPKHSPDIFPFSVYSVMIPATEVGGDYYDYVRFLDGSYGVIIADVAGKGIPAALYMATLKGAVLAEMRVSSGPADLLRRVNETLMGSMERRSYISLTCVQFSISRGSIRLARAGHTPAITRVGGTMDVILPAGVAIGIVGPAVFNSAIEEKEIVVTAGDMFLLTTDGVNERRNLQSEEIGMDAIAEMVRLSTCADATALVQSTIGLIEAHAGGAEPHDDITIVGIVVTGLLEDQRITTTSESFS